MESYSGTFNFIYQETLSAKEYPANVAGPVGRITSSRGLFSDSQPERKDSTAKKLGSPSAVILDLSGSIASGRGSTSEIHCAQLRLIPVLVAPGPATKWAREVQLELKEA